MHRPLHFETKSLALFYSRTFLHEKEMLTALDVIGESDCANV